MARWAPDARERLETAALELFQELGYEETTVAQIADRAGLNRATFFRHFADKREVLFGGEDDLAVLFADGVHGAAPGATLADCLQNALVLVGDTMTPQQRVRAVQRVRVSAASAEVRERGLLKLARIAGAIRTALVARGFDDLTARMWGELGLLAFRVGVERWVGADHDESFAGHAATALAELQARTSPLTGPVSDPGS
jgi:AcrR family transcriptional regulator